MSETVSLKLDDVAELAESALVNQGFSIPQARAIARVISLAERDQCSSHGLFRVPFYVKALGNPTADPQATPTVNDQAPGIVRVDAQRGFCPLALEVGLPLLADKARSQGIAALSINHSYNIAALWPEVETLAEQGLVAMAFTCANAFVAPAGGTRPLYGTNPMAFAWPRAGQAPLVFDQASSTSARGEIQLHLRDGKPIPEGWAIDNNGQPTTDPEAALAGAQLTFGGYKGAAIALMVELLAGALLGDLFSYESTETDTAGSGAPFGGELVLAFDPQRFVSNTATGTAADPAAHAEQLFARILEQDGTRLPGDRRVSARAITAQEGVKIPASLHQTLMEYIG